MIAITDTPTMSAILPTAHVGRTVKISRFRDTRVHVQGIFIGHRLCECMKQLQYRFKPAMPRRLQHMGCKGWGLVAAQPIAAGSFVIEYIGKSSVLSGQLGRHMMLS